MNEPTHTTHTTTAGTENVRAWILCAPACAAMIGLNLLPAARALVQGPPRPLVDELTSLGSALLSVGADAIATTAMILAVEVPLAIYLAVCLLRRNGSERPTGTPPWLLTAVVAGLSWRLLFGGSLGFLQQSPKGLPIIILEIWRSLPLSTLLFYAVLRHAETDLAQVARLEVPGVVQAIRRVLLPVCEPAIWLLGALRLVDYLRGLDTTGSGPEPVERAVWTLLAITVSALAMRIAPRRASSI